jgi:hypothetical protein
LNVCLTDGFRWQFTRFYPYNDLTLIGDYNYSGGKLGDLMREYPQLKENTDSTDPIGYQLSLANHLLIHRMHGCPDYLLKSSVAEMQKLTELLASEAYEKATSAADDNNRLAVKYFTSDVYDLLSNDGPFVLAILQWWLRGLTPFRGAFHIE